MMLMKHLSERILILVRTESATAVPRFETVITKVMQAYSCS